MAEDENRNSFRDLARTGIPGLDDILNGGLTRSSINLVEGESGTGKTILGMQFAMEGLRQKEGVLYLALSETRKDLEDVARSHGWDIEKLNILEASSLAEQPSSMFHPSEVELNQVVQMVKESVDRAKPARLVIDSLSEFRILGQSTIHFRRAILSLKRFLASLDCTVLLLEEPGGQESPRSLADSVITLQILTPDYGTDRRKLKVRKLRGRRYSGGYHDFLIRKGGLNVFPRLIAAEHRIEGTAEILNSGSNELDTLMGGGIRTGSSTLVVGPAGSGKTNICMLFVASALKRGEEALFFAFDERPEKILRRAEALNLDLQTGITDGRLHLQQVDPAELSPGQFAHMIKQWVETRKVSVVVIDSLNGYLHSMPDERFLILHMHELLNYLGQQGVSSFLVMGQTGIGRGWRTPVDTSYLTDNVILVRFFEAEGEIRRAVSVIKQRTGHNEPTIRELLFEAGRISIGAPLNEFKGILTGTPEFTGVSGSLKEKSDVGSS